eukprot:GHVR01054878.1.p1 GENE.GHVR01054878.1~~GHVR01054878.1.p1  ORF type:complete len:323 (-),score=47.00 GHVR01054878.1:117-1085(-)
MLQKKYMDIYTYGKVTAETTSSGFPEFDDEKAEITCLFGVKGINDRSLFGLSEKKLYLYNKMFRYTSDESDERPVLKLQILEKDELSIKELKEKNTKVLSANTYMNLIQKSDVQIDMRRYTTLIPKTIFQQTDTFVHYGNDNCKIIEKDTRIIANSIIKATMPPFISKDGSNNFDEWNNNVWGDGKNGVLHYKDEKLTNFAKACTLKVLQDTYVQIKLYAGDKNEVIFELPIFNNNKEDILFPWNIFFVKHKDTDTNTILIGSGALQERRIKSQIGMQKIYEQSRDEKDILLFYLHRNNQFEIVISSDKVKSPNNQIISTVS